MRNVLIVLVCAMPFHLAFAQSDISWTQVNYEDLTTSIMDALADEVEKMNLEFIRFNFYQQNDTDVFPVEFLRQGVDLKALGGLEYLMFDRGGQIVERRYKYYSEELLMSTPLEMIMTMQEKTAGRELKFLTKIVLLNGETSYQAITPDSTYIFSEKMNFLHSKATE